MPRCVGENKGTAVKNDLSVSKDYSRGNDVLCHKYQWFYLESHYKFLYLSQQAQNLFFDFTLVFIGRLELEGTLSDQIGNVKLFDERRNCKIDNLPMDISDAAVVDNIICGGKIETPKLEVTNACMQLLKNGTWVFTHPMKERRYMFTMTKIGWYYSHRRNQLWWEDKSSQHDGETKFNRLVSAFWRASANGSTLYYDD